MTRRRHLTLIAAAATGSLVAASAKDNPSMFQQILEASMTEKKGVTLWIKGQSLPGIVTKLNGDSVEMRSREYSRIVVKLEAIDAAAMA